MPRVRHAKSSRKRKKRILKLAKGQRGARSKLIRTATESLRRALRYNYRDRKVRKREFRALWIARVNAAARAAGIPYSRLISGLKKADVKIDRKMLADLAVNDPKAFKELAKIAQEAKS